MPKTRNDSFLRKSIPNFISELRKKVTNQNSLGAHSILTLLTDLEQLRAQDIAIFGEDGTRQPSIAELNTYSQLSGKCRVNLSEIGNFVTNNEVKDPGVKSSAKTIADNSDTILRELKPYLKIKQPDYNWQLTQKEKEEADLFIASSLEGFDRTANERITSLHGRRNFKSKWMEFPSSRNTDKDHILSKIPSSVLLSGNVNDLAAFYVKNKNTIDAVDQNYLKNRIASMMYLNDLQQNATPSAPAFGYSKKKRFFGASTLKLTGYEGKYQYQTTGNGCWSCSYAMLFESRGVSLNQQIIRAYRPDLGVAESSRISAFDASGLINDDIFSPYEIADLTSKVLPNTALRQVGAPYFNSADPVSKQNAKEFIKATVTEAIIKHNSPVAFNTGTHFMTIVGLRGDNVILLNSLSDQPGLEEVRSLDSLLKDKVSISMSYMQDLNFTKDGKCTNIPKAFGNIEYNEGKLANASSEVAGINVSGESFVSYKKFGKLKVTDSLYLPNTVPEAIYNPKLEKNNVKEETAKKNVQEEQIQNGIHEETVKPEKKPISDVKTENKVQSKPKQKLDTAALITNEINEAQAQMRKIAANWDNLADPQEAMRFTVATLLAERTLLEAYEQSSDINKDQQFVKSLNNRKNVYQIAKSEKFNDFYTSMKTEEILKLCECKPENFKAVQDSFYNKFVNHMPEDPSKKQNVEVKSDPELKQENDIKQENKENKSKNQIVQTDTIDFIL